MRIELFSAVTKLLVAASALITAACERDERPLTSTIYEYCLSGEFDLGARLQGMHPRPGEYRDTHWCVTTDAESDRVQFSISGHSNPDMESSFTVSYMPPEQVRIVRRDSPPDVQFAGKSIANEAARQRRVNPWLLVQELRERPELVVGESADGTLSVRYPDSRAVSTVRIERGKLRYLRTEADMPLRGRVPVEWQWTWTGEDTGSVVLGVDNTRMLRMNFTRRAVAPDNAAELWSLSDDLPPIDVPGEEWPARVAMQLESLAPGVHRVRGVRTGFNHLIVETDEGLVIGDAPAGWVELTQIPPADLVPGLGISGLSEGLVDLLHKEFDGVPIRAVGLTHAHDDHAGGARAFAAAGASIYAPAAVADFLESALNRGEMPADRFQALDEKLRVLHVQGRTVLSDSKRVVELIETGPGPHVAASLGILVREPAYFFQSDLHVPNSDSEEPRSDRASTECWFARWAVDNLPADTVVLSSHVEQTTPVSRLARYLESEKCG